MKSQILIIFEKKFSTFDIWTPILNMFIKENDEISFSSERKLKSIFYPFLFSIEK